MVRFHRSFPVLQVTTSRLTSSSTRAAAKLAASGAASTTTRSSRSTSSSSSSSTSSSTSTSPPRPQPSRMQNTFRFSGRCQYVTCALDAEEICKKILREKVSLVGVDAEWNMSYRKNHRSKVALLQLAYEDKSPLARDSWPLQLIPSHASLQRKMQVKLFHLKHFLKFPPSLKRILEDDNILKVGVNIKGDCTRLVNDNLITVSENKVAWVDTEKLARKKINPGSAASPQAAVGKDQVDEITNFTLASLCAFFYGVPMDKAKKTRCSDWENLPLTNVQQVYAATDAASHLSTYWALETLQDLPESEQLKYVRKSSNKGAGGSSSGSSSNITSFNLEGMVCSSHYSLTGGSGPVIFLPRFASASLALKLRKANRLKVVKAPACFDTTLPEGFFSSGEEVVALAEDGSSRSTSPEIRTSDTTFDGTTVSCGTSSSSTNSEVDATTGEESAPSFAAGAQPSVGASAAQSAAPDEDAPPGKVRNMLRKPSTSSASSRRKKSSDQEAPVGVGATQENLHMVSEFLGTKVAKPPLIEAPAVNIVEDIEDTNLVLKKRRIDVAARGSASATNARAETSGGGSSQADANDGAAAGHLAPQEGAANKPRNKPKVKPEPAPAVADCTPLDLENPQSHQWLFVPQRISTYSPPPNNGSDGCTNAPAGAASSGGSSSPATSATDPGASPSGGPRPPDDSMKPPLDHEILLPNAVHRVWLRVFQQGYTLEEVGSELNLKPQTVQSYVTKALVCGKHYIWGPQMGVSDEELGQLVDYLSSGPIHAQKNINDAADALDLDTGKAHIALLHLKRLFDAGSVEDVCRVLPVLNPHQLPRQIWAVRRTRGHFIFAKKTAAGNAVGGDGSGGASSPPQKAAAASTT
ncbi:unnamed protein product [Amoebophrya sp. A120]|nr:unnamed protein product [Amoebophrya sp. A120]|eukprot:GSA120T00018750001.1